MPGTYTFRPIQANLTHDTEWLGKMDPYCSYRTGTARVKGPVCRNGGKFPKWEDAAVNVPIGNEPSLVVDLMDKDKILFDDNIGSFVIDLQEIQSKGQLSKWYPVYWKQKPAGEILMEAAFQPEFVQQQVIVEPVVVKQTIIEEPVIVKEVIREEFVQVPHQQEFVSGGPIIQGISQIHHGGHGVGLVPQSGNVISQGTYQEGSTLSQGGHHHHHHGPFPEGTTIHQGNLPSNFPQAGSTSYQGTNYQGGSTIHQGGSTIHQGGLQQGFNQGGLQQGGLQQGFNQGGLQQGQYNQGSLNQGEFGQGNLNQGGLNQGLNQGEFGQGNLNQGGLNQGLNQGSTNVNHGQF